jgi:hypothetical protein
VIHRGWRIGAKTCQDNPVDDTTSYFNCASVGTINKCDAVVVMGFLSISDECNCTNKI